MSEIIVSMKDLSYVWGNDSHHILIPFTYSACTENRWILKNDSGLPCAEQGVTPIEALAKSEIPLLSYITEVYHTFIPCHDLVCKDLNHLSLPQGIILVHYIDDIVLTGSNEQEVATIGELLVRHLFDRLWGINLTKVCTSISGKYPGVQWCGEY